MAPTQISKERMCEAIGQIIDHGTEDYITIVGQDGCLSVRVFSNTDQIQTQVNDMVLFLKNNMSYFAWIHFVNRMQKEDRK